MYGSGTAGTGIADQISDAIAVESEKSKEEALKQIYCIDKPGILLESMKDNLTPAQHPYARPDRDFEGVDGKSLLEIVKHVKPHVLIGTSTKPKSFTKEVVQEMAKHIDRPIIFPLSNPTRLHEADPKDLFEWTDGKVLTATGSPFPPVETKDGRIREIAECNNSTTFPGIGKSRTSRFPPPANPTPSRPRRSPLPHAPPSPTPPRRRDQSARGLRSRAQRPRRRSAPGRDPRARDQRQNCRGSD